MVIFFIQLIYCEICYDRSEIVSTCSVFIGLILIHDSDKASIQDSRKINSVFRIDISDLEKNLRTYNIWITPSCQVTPNDRVVNWLEIREVVDDLIQTLMSFSRSFSMTESAFSLSKAPAESG